MYNNENIVLCASSAYEKKFFFNSDFEALPEQIKQELNILSVLYTEDIGGVLRLEFDDEGNLLLKTEVSEDDFSFDEIGSALKIKELRRNHKDLFESIELYFQTFFL
ncbi:MAG TPA: hypothetical protein GXZ90_03465 [Clostridiales bacterium]|nr:hypothetical protein [Clostridiales bacterium]